MDNDPHTFARAPKLTPRAWRTSSRRQNPSESTRIGLIRLDSPECTARQRSLNRRGALTAWNAPRASAPRTVAERLLHGGRSRNPEPQFFQRAKGRLAAKELKDHESPAHSSLSLSLRSLPFDWPFRRAQGPELAEGLRALSRFDTLKALSPSKGERSESKRRSFAAIPHPTRFGLIHLDSLRFSTIHPSSSLPPPPSKTPRFGLIRLDSPGFTLIRPDRRPIFQPHGDPIQSPQPVSVQSAMHCARARILDPRSAHRMECTARKRPSNRRGAPTAWRQEPQPGASIRNPQCTTRQRSLSRRGALTA
jgi:hypothetical protein